MTGESFPSRLLVVGLGNPGERYRRTRHNFGYRILEAWSQTLGWTFKTESKFYSQKVQGAIGNCETHLLLPTTYMNESGLAVRRYVDYFKLEATQLLVLCDDIDLPFGKIRFRLNGGPGTHNGLKSVQSSLGSQEYSRLRLGVGAPLNGEPLADYVLSNFSAEEENELPNIIRRTIGALELLTRLPMAEALPAINSSMT